MESRDFVGSVAVPGYRRIPEVARVVAVPPGVLRAGLDFSVILLGQGLIGLLSVNAGSLQKILEFWALAAAVGVMLIFSHGGYRPDCLGKPMRGADLAVRCFLATSLTMITVALMLGHGHVVARLWTPFALCVTSLLLVLVRSLPRAGLLAAAAPEAGPGPLVICYDAFPPGLTAAFAAQMMPERAAGVLFLAGPPGDARRPDCPVIPDVPAVLELIRARGIQDVIFIYQPALEAVSAATRRQLLSELLAYPARIWLAVDTEPQLQHLFPRQAPFQLVQIGAAGLVSSRNPAKRLFDVVFATLFLAAAMPLLPVIALMVRLSGPGPVVFRQSRVGAQGREVTVLKFRTMRHVEGAGFLQACESDERVTRVGRFLRRSSMDELLQLINVIKGDMSLVGPRPHAPETQVEGVNFENAVKFYRVRHRVKPGMTGLAQIRGERGETRVLQTLERRIASDLEYIETWSVGLDFVILLRTLPALLTQKNAY